MNKTPQYIMDFLKAICPDAPELYMTLFDEKKCLTNATTVINDLRKEKIWLLDVLELLNGKVQDYINTINSSSRPRSGLGESFNNLCAAVKRAEQVISKAEGK